MEKVSGFNGKGSGSRVSDKKRFDENWDRIFAKRGGRGSSKIPVELKVSGSNNPDYKIGETIKFSGFND